MKLELTLLVCAVGLAFVQLVVAVLAAMAQVGLPTLLGNREEMPALSGLAGRAERAYKNMFESLLLFAALVLVAAVAGKTNAQTALGAQIFVWARLAFAVIYVVGIPVARTAAWAVAIIGLIMIALQLT